MAKISSFSMALAQKKEDAPESESIRLFRKLSESEDVRVLLGDFFLKLAACESDEIKNPHVDLLKRMIGDRELTCNDQLMILAKNLDLLRQYDIGRQKLADFRKRFINKTEN